MTWLKKNKKCYFDPSYAMVQADINKRKVTNAVEDAKKTNKHFADVLEKNNITIKIFRAVGGKKKGENL